MNRKKPWLENKWWLLIIFLVLIIIPFGINELYKYGAKTGQGYCTLWGADDALAFYGTILSVASTAYLGYIAIRQNDRLMRLEEINSNRECSSDIIVGQVDKKITYIPLSNEYETKYISAKEIEFKIENCGRAVLNEIQLYFNSNEIFYSHIILPSGEKKNVIIDIPEESKEDDLVKITFVSCYGVKTYGDFRISSGIGGKYIKYYHYYGLNKVDICSE